MHETVPADIAAAIDELASLLRPEGHEFSRTREDDIISARVILNRAILHHLRNADAMKAALERIEQGV